MASTVSAVKLADGKEFSAIAPNPPSSLLRVNVPIGLQYGSNPGSIVNQSRAIDSKGQIFGLQVLRGQTIAIVGGEIQLQRGQITAPQGRIEFGSIANNNLVSLQPIETGFALGYRGGQNFQNIQFSQQAAIPTTTLRYCQPTHINMNRDALVVGINQYPFLKDTSSSKAKHLKTPANDAEAIAQRLEEYGGFRVRRLPETIQDGQRRVAGATGALVQADALEDAIIQLFNPVGERIPQTALLYFIGHGLRKNRGGVTEGFLATSDTDPRKNQWGVSLRWLRELLQKSPVQQQIVWLDCCCRSSTTSKGNCPRFAHPVALRLGSPSIRIASPLAAR